MSASLELVKLGLSGIAGGGLSGLLAIWAKARQTSLDTSDQINRSIEIVTKGMRDEIQRLHDDLAEVRQQNKECEENARKLQRQVDMLMAERIPSYRAGDLRRYIDGKFYDANPNGEGTPWGTPGPGKGDPGGDEGGS